MPTDRSPLRSETEVMVTPANSRDQVRTEILNLPPVNPLQMGECSQINSNEFRLLKLPIFWHKQPKLWFAQIESEFVVYRIRSDDIKYSSVIRHLDEQALVSISEVIENPPTTDKYNHLKNVLINRFTDSEVKRLRQLLAGIELNDKNFSAHIQFIILLTQNLGISPLLSDEIYLNPEKGIFESSISHHIFDKINSNLWKKILSNGYSTTLSNKDRKNILESILVYYSIHVAEFRRPISLEVIQQIWE